jgi:hypothetical protein
MWGLSQGLVIRAIKNPFHVFVSTLWSVIAIHIGVTDNRIGVTDGDWITRNGNRGFGYVVLVEKVVYGPFFWSAVVFLIISSTPFSTALCLAA